MRTVRLLVLFFPLLLIGCMSSIDKSVLEENIATMENNLVLLKGEKLSPVQINAYRIQTRRSIATSKEALKNLYGELDEETIKNINNYKKGENNPSTDQYHERQIFNFEPPNRYMFNSDFSTPESFIFQLKNIVKTKKEYDKKYNIFMTQIKELLDPNISKEILENIN